MSTSLPIVHDSPMSLMQQPWSVWHGLCQCSCHSVCLYTSSSSVCISQSGPNTEPCRSLSWMCTCCDGSCADADLYFSQLQDTVESVVVGWTKHWTASAGPLWHIQRESVSKDAVQDVGSDKNKHVSLHYLFVWLATSQTSFRSVGTIWSASVFIWESLHRSKMRSHWWCWRHGVSRAHVSTELCTAQKPATQPAIAQLVTLNVSLMQCMALLQKHFKSLYNLTLSWKMKKSFGNRRYAGIISCYLFHLNTLKALLVLFLFLFFFSIVFYSGSQFPISGLAYGP